MSDLSRAQQVVHFLKNNPQEKFSARRIAEFISDIYKEDFSEKRSNPKFSNEEDFLRQVAAEVSSSKNSILKADARISCERQARSDFYCFNLDADIDPTDPDADDVEVIESVALHEKDLYPILIEYLSAELKLYCQRIDERRSRNSRGNGGNQWLHPDIVAMQPVDKGWDELIRNCVKQGAGQRVRLWSFEVKKELNLSNARKSFFQAVSNSSWANEGYLVATSIRDAETEKELRMLSALHGIGVILLDVENCNESEMLLPARSRPEVDWESTNRILIENDDFKDYIELVSTYYQTGRIRPNDWNKINR